MNKKYNKFLTSAFAAYNVQQDGGDLTDGKVLKLLDAFTKLRKELETNGFKVGRMYAMPSIMFDKELDMYFGKLETDAECSTWMIREYLPVLEEGNSADWDEGDYDWDTGIYTPPGVMVTVKIK